MNIDLIIKIVLLIVVVGISIKVFKAITGMIFKVALVALVLLILYKMVM